MKKFYFLLLFTIYALEVHSAQHQEPKSQRRFIPYLPTENKLTKLGRCSMVDFFYARPQLECFYFQSNKGFAVYQETRTQKNFVDILELRVQNYLLNIFQGKK
jgi:hypothetical protein